MIAFCTHTITMFGVTFSSFYIFARSIQYKADKNHNILAMIWCFLWAALYGYTAVSSFTPISIIKPLTCLSTVVFVFIVTRHKLIEQKELTYRQVFEITAAAYLFSFGISYFLNYMAVLLVSIPSMFLLSSETVVDAPINYNDPIYLLLYSLSTIILLFLSVFLFKIKQFKNGFPFIFKKYTIVAALFFTGMILVFVTWVSMLSKSENSPRNNSLSRGLIIIGVLIAGSAICILILRLIKNYQRTRIRQHSDNQLQKQNLELREEIEQLKKRNDEIEKAKSSAVHSINDKIKALREAIEKGNATLDDIDNLEKAWESEHNRFKEKKRLASANVRGIDILFDYYENQFTKDNIVFELILDGNIKYMVDNVIRQNHFETLITNHLSDAKIAVNAGNNTYRRVTAIIRFKDYYEFTVFDSGIPFETDTLVRLGTKRVTTHADTGGSGIGFETTFEIMREYSASLIISEQEESNIDFSKSVTIRFDGKHRYIIETYRPEDFPENERYTIITPI